MDESFAVQCVPFVMTLLLRSLPGRLEGDMVNEFHIH
jgi:hypothetical protein